MRKSSYIHLLVIITASLLLISKPACANAGTPLMWLSVGHLFFGNALIGIFEGLIVAKIFRAHILRSILIMVLANYTSMVIGILGIGVVGNWLNTNISINSALVVIIAMLTASYVATIFTEWPFCFWIFKGKDNRNTLSFKASVIINTASYATALSGSLPNPRLC